MKSIFILIIFLISMFMLTGFSLIEKESEPVSYNTFYHNNTINEEDNSKPSIPTSDIVVLDDLSQNDTTIVEIEPEEPKGAWVWAKVTAYTPWDAIDKNSGYQDGYTSIMKDTRVEPYGIAADTRILPYGTKIYVPGYFESLLRNKTNRPNEMTVVDDTGAYMRRSWDRGIIHIDVRYRTSAAAKKWGTRWMYIFVFDN